MNTIKTLFVTVTLLAVGYGTHIVINGPAKSPMTNADNIWVPEIELPGVPNGAPNFELPPLLPTPNLRADISTETSPPRIARTGDSNPFSRKRNLPHSSNGPSTALVEIPDLAVPGSPGGNDRYERPDLSIDDFYPSDVRPQDLQPPETGQDIFATPGRSHVTPPPPATAGPLKPPANRIDMLGADASATPRNDSQPIAQTAHLNPNAGAIDLGPNQANATFATTWQSAQAQIGSGELAAALAALSAIYNQPMDNQQRGQMVSLLDQLAGTVIYSQQHLLHPAHTPREGETIAQVAARQGVPADFLARVNNISPHQPLSSSKQIKIVTGPFRGELSPSRRELTLFLGQHYAGRFGVSIGSDFPSQITALEVFEKAAGQDYLDPRTGQQIPAGDPTNPFGAHWIGLRSSGMPGRTANCGLHSMGAGLDASDSRGCIGLGDNDADDLKAILELGSTITMVR